MWVCKAHPDRPWVGEDACGCGAAGAPCPICNKEDLPQPPLGFKIDTDKKGGDIE